MFKKRSCKGNLRAKSTNVEVDCTLDKSEIEDDDKIDETIASIKAEQSLRRR